MPFKPADAYARPLEPLHAHTVLPDHFGDRIAEQLEAAVVTPEGEERLGQRMAGQIEIASDRGGREGFDPAEGASRRDLHAEAAEEDGRAFCGKLRVVFHPDALEVLDGGAALVDLRRERIAYEAQAVLLVGLEEPTLHGLAGRRDEESSTDRRSVDGARHGGNAIKHESGEASGRSVTD